MKARASNAKDAGITYDVARQVPTGFRSTELGLLPTEWDVRTLGELGQSLIGLTYDPQDIDPSGVLVLRSSNIGHNSLQFGGDVYVKTDIPDRIVARRDDLLICVRNGSRPLIGKCALIDERAVAMTFGAFMSVFRSDDNRFVFHCFQSDIIKRQINEHLGATINQITNKSLNSFKIPYPEESERKAIAQALSDVDELLGALDALMAKKLAIKRGAAQQLLSGMTRLPGYDHPWKVARIGDLLDYERPDRYIVRSAEYSEHGNVPVLTANKAFVLGFTDETFGVCRDVPAIVFDDFTTDCKFAQIPFKVKSSAIKILRPKHARVSLKYMFERMQLLCFPSETHKRYYIAEYQETRIFIPDYDEQLAIVSAMSDMDVEIAALEQRRDKMLAVKQGMMQELLTGRTRLIQSVCGATRSIR